MTRSPLAAKPLLATALIKYRERYGEGGEREQPPDEREGPKRYLGTVALDDSTPQ